MKSPALELMNSYHIGGSADRIDDRLNDDVWRRSFSARWELTELSDAEVSKLRRVRDWLREISAELTDNGTVSDANLELLNYRANSVQGGRLLSRDSGGELSLVFTPHRTMAASQLVITRFQELVSGMGEARLRLCANPMCKWAFYDSTKNRSRKWCDSQECGNVMKARAFRARHKVSRKLKS
jgi:predicted RNA-binding Zn ribbon-like protein